MTTKTAGTYFDHAGALRRDRELRGTQWLFQFGNGYGASVIQGPYSYGGPEGLFELAVLHGDDPTKSELCYASPITNDVIGHQSETQIAGLLDDIAALPANYKCDHAADWS